MTTEKYYETVVELHCKGFSISQIAIKTHLPENKVYEFIMDYFRSL